MNRRDLLLLRPTPRTRVLELPCERLYMQYLDIRRPNAPAQTADDHYPLGEPEPSYAGRSSQDLFDGLARELRGADVLRVVGPDWLADSELKREVDRLVLAFTARGGRVEFIEAERNGRTA